MVVYGMVLKTVDRKVDPNNEEETTKRERD